MRNRINPSLPILMFVGSLALFAGCDSTHRYVDASKTEEASKTNADPAPTTEPNDEEALLPDGVYPVALREAGDVIAEKTDDVIELENVPVPGSEESDVGDVQASQTITVHATPLLLFRELSRFDFQFEQNECTEIGFDNNDQLRAYTRDHPGGRLAVVVAGRVVSHHKIREPITSQRLRITCCTEGGGDHLYNHLSQLKMVSHRTDANFMDDQ